jgi:hypothetical protein
VVFVALSTPSRLSSPASSGRPSNPDVTAVLDRYPGGNWVARSSRATTIERP